MDATSIRSSSGLTPIRAQSADEISSGTLNSKANSVRVATAESEPSTAMVQEEKGGKEKGGEAREWVKGG